MKKVVLIGESKVHIENFHFSPQRPFSSLRFLLCHIGKWVRSLCTKWRRVNVQDCRATGKKQKIGEAFKPDPNTVKPVIRTHRLFSINRFLLIFFDFPINPGRFLSKLIDPGRFFLKMVDRRSKPDHRFRFHQLVCAPACFTYGL